MESDGPHVISTAIWNRQSIIELLARELARTAHEGRNLFVLLVGVDQLQTICDQHGQSYGELVMGEVAKRLAGSLRSYDHIGRYSAEHLLILPLSSELTGTFPLAEGLREVIAQQPLQISGKTLPVTASISLTSSGDFPSRNSYEILQELESGLHRAQAAGGDRVETVRVIRPIPDPHRRGRDPLPVRLIVSLVLVASIAGLLLFKPVSSCAPYRLYDIFSSNELPPPLPVNCSATTERPLPATLEALDQQREAARLSLQETVTCKVSLSSKNRAERIRDQQWLSTLYVNGSYQYRQHVFLAAWQDVPGGRLLTIEVCLMHWWDYLKQPGDACWGQYRFWK